MFPFSRRRAFFRFHDGNHSRKVDPSVVWRKLFNDLECDPSKDFGPACGYGGPNGNKFDAEAQDRVLALAQRAFGISPWDETTGTGLTVNETLEVIWSYMAYMDGLKKKPSQLRTTSAHTESESSPDGSSPQNSESDSASTETEPSTGEQPSSSKRSVHL